MLKPRESIARMSPYQSPIVSRAGLSLDLNESMAGCSPRVLSRLHSLSVADVSLYPEREAGERIVANFLGIQPEQVLLTNGADEALSLLFATYLAPGDELLFADPTFGMYPMLGEALGAKLVSVPSGKDLAFPTTAALSRISPRTRAITIANPNNPTGLAASRADLLKIAEAAPDAAVLIDEAYFEFCGDTLLPDLPSHPNLFVARTLSKAYGLAGLRLGVLTGTAEQIGYIRRHSAPFNVNSVVMACLEEALGRPGIRTQSGSAGETRPRTTGGVVRRAGPALLAKSGEFRSSASRHHRESVRGVDAAARHPGPRFIVKPRLRRLRPNHRRNAQPDGWSGASDS